MISCLLLWTVLYFATTRKNFLLFCGLALAQVSFIAIVGLRFQSENRIVAEVMAELPKQQELWTAKIPQCNMGPRYEMCAGERMLSLEELRELHACAQAARSAIPELNTEVRQWAQQAESRIAKVSPQGAREFRLGVESRQSESAEILQTTLKLYGEDEQLMGFLIEREQHYRIRAGSLAFDTEQDAKRFKDKMATIALLREQLDELTRKARGASQPTTAGH